MKSKNVSPISVSQSEAQLLERLRQHPEMRERVQSILDIAYSAEGPLKSADQVEELLIQEMRRLGNTSMQQWAMQAEQRVSRELKAQDATVRSRKKKTLKSMIAKVGCLVDRGHLQRRQHFILNHFPSSWSRAIF